MDAIEYLLSIKFDDKHLPDLFNEDDKSYYTIPELMEYYHQAKLKLLGITAVVQAKPEKVRFVRCTKCEGLGHYYENGIIFKCKH